MKKLKYLFLIIVATFMSVTFVKADTYPLDDLEIQGYNNNGSSLTSPSEFGCSGGSCGMYITTNANSYGGAWVIESPIPLLSNYTYTLTLRIRSSVANNIALSAKNHIAIGNSISSAKYNYETSRYYCNMNFSDAIGDYTLQFAFTATGGGSYLTIPFTTSTTTSANYMIDAIIISNIGNNGVSSTDINNSLNSQTNQINSSINNSTNTITGAIDDVEESINNNIKDNFNSCRDSYNLLHKATSKTENGISFNVQNDGSIIINGTATGTASINLTNNSNGSISLSPNTYTLSGDFSGGSDTTFRMCTNATGTNLCTYGSKITFTVTNDVNDRAIWFVVYSGTTLNNLVLKPMLNIGSSALSYEPYGEICKNKIDETNDQLNDLNQNITNDDVGGVENAFESFENFISENSTITQLITMPITLYSSILNGLQSTCQPFNLGNLFGTNLIIPCINIGNYLGTVLWSMIDIIISGFAIFAISKKFIKIFNNFSSMKEGDVIND